VAFSMALQEDVALCLAGIGEQNGLLQVATLRLVDDLDIGQMIYI